MYGIFSKYVVFAVWLVLVSILTVRFKDKGCIYVTTIVKGYCTLMLWKVSKYHDLASYEILVSQTLYLLASGKKSRQTCICSDVQLFCSFIALHWCQILSNVTVIMLKCSPEYYCIFARHHISSFLGYLFRLIVEEYRVW